MFKDFCKYHLRYNSLFSNELKRLFQYKELSENELLDAKNIAFLEILKAASKSKFYSKFYAEFGINFKSIKNLDDIELLPVINKNMIRNYVDEIWVGGIIKKRGFTSGSSGSPLTIYRDLNSIIKEQAYVWHYRISKGLNLKERLLSLRGVLNRGNLSRFDKVSNVLYLSSYDLNIKTARLYYKKIKEFKPKAIEAYPSSVYSLAMCLKQIGAKLDIPFVFTSSESLYTYQKDLIENFFNCKIYDWYGNAERSIALQLEDDGRYYEPFLYSVNEFKEDCVLTTSLINKSFPLIRYKVEDVFSDVKQGEFVTSVGNILGRQDDIVLLKDGTRIGRLDHVFKKIKNVKYAQIIQNKDYSILIKVDKANGYSIEDEKKIIQNLRKYLGNKCQVKVCYCDVSDFELLKSGKFQFVINKIINEN